MYKRIIAAVDGSPTSNHALRQALHLARTEGAELRVVHVVDLGWLPFSPELTLDIGAIAQARQAAGEKLLAEARQLCATEGVRAQTGLVETLSPNERTSAAIARDAAAWGADLLVLGTHGRRGIDRLLLGSVAENTVRFSPIPLLLVPHPLAPAG